MKARWQKKWGILEKHIITFVLEDDRVIRWIHEASGLRRNEWWIIERGEKELEELEGYTPDLDMAAIILVLDAQLAADGFSRVE